MVQVCHSTHNHRDPLLCQGDIEMQLGTKPHGYTSGFSLKIPDTQTSFKIPVLSKASFLNGRLWVCIALWLWTSNRAGQCIPCRSVPH